MYQTEFEVRLSRSVLTQLQLLTIAQPDPKTIGDGLTMIVAEQDVGVRSVAVEEEREATDTIVVSQSRYLLHHQSCYH